MIESFYALDQWCVLYATARAPPGAGGLRRFSGDASEALSYDERSFLLSPLKGGRPI